jgi:hypothetical protein
VALFLALEFHEAGNFTHGVFLVFKGGADPPSSPRRRGSMPSFGSLYRLPGCAGFRSFGMGPVFTGTMLF